ncbi:xylan 1,4-beta-xylosidase [Cladochytrium replicatum]|nr:xylan 1,4-beta-xylosidase [Cladochytrium replicatum]
MIPPTKFFNAHHSPVGAFASFTLGAKGPSGGMAQMVGRPPNHNVYVGIQKGPSPKAGAPGWKFQALPFYATEGDDIMANYTGSVEGLPTTSCLQQFHSDEISREYDLTTDAWKAGDLEFTVISPVKSIPEYKGDATPLRDVILPAVFAELTIDNSQSDEPRRAIFGVHNLSDSRNISPVHHLGEESSGEGLVGIASGRETALVACAYTDEVRSAGGFTIDHIFAPKNNTEDNWRFGLGQCALLVFEVPARTKRCYPIALCFYAQGVVTTGLEASFLYTELWKDIHDVAKYAVDNHSTLIQSWRTPDQAEIFARKEKLTPEQKFQFIHAIHSYFGSTELLVRNKEAVWVVNEGEYRMMNTCDLMLDHAFFECVLNPWVVRNILDLFYVRYSYIDEVVRPGSSETFPGGLSFCHDMGMGNAFTPKGTSSYECVKLDDCFSFMTSEELTNWVLTAAVYLNFTRDSVWAEKNLQVFKDCFTSLLNRDSPTEDGYSGLVQLESSRTKGGAEITTYDALDTALAQTRRSAYIGSKTWACYLVLEKIFSTHGLSAEAALACAQAERAADTIVKAFNDETSLLPSLIDDPKSPTIIPVVEGLIYPFVAGRKDALDLNGKFAKYLAVLKKHCEAALTKGICVFDDNGWKLSAGSINSWLSKIYLNQYVVYNILGVSEDGRDASDKAHVGWLTDGENGYWAWSDQMYGGIPKGSLYYPRGVTAILWVEPEAQGYAIVEA